MIFSRRAQLVWVSLIGLLLSTAAAWGAANSWLCQYGQYQVQVSLDPATRQIAITDNTGTVQGTAMVGAGRGSDYYEYTLPSSTYYYNYFYYFYVPRAGGSSAEFRYCWDCAPYACQLQ